MELNWSTFILEIINFLVLVWILKRFLYKPVLEVIAKRRSGIEQQLAEAHRLNEEADALKSEYDNRLADRDKERQQAREALAQELDAERTRQMENLQQMLTEERKKAEVAEERQRNEAQRETEQRALQQGAEFASRLLGQAAGPELEARLCQLLLDGLNQLTEQEITALRTQWGEPPKVIEITSAYPLSSAQQQQLEKALSNVTGLDIPFHYAQDADLLAGLNITVGAWLLQTNLRDELKGFAEIGHAH